MLIGKLVLRRVELGVGFSLDAWKNIEKVGIFFNHCTNWINIDYKPHPI